MEKLLDQYRQAILGQDLKKAEEIRAKILARVADLEAITGVKWFTRGARRGYHEGIEGK